MRLPLNTLLLARAAPVSGQVNDTTLTLPASEPPYSQPLDPQLGSFSIEMDHWRDWAGPTVGAPNAFVNTALGQLSSRTGKPVYLRVGANSEDRATLDLDVAVMDAEFPPPTPAVPAPEASAIRIGRDFYALSANLPPGTDLHWGVNLKALNQDETRAQLAHLAETFERPELAHVHLRAVELGNEADFYAGRHGAGIYKEGWEDWDAANYTATWVRSARDALPLFDWETTTLSPGSFANLLTLSGMKWPAAACYQAGMLADPEIRAATRQFSMHTYSGAFEEGMPVHIGSLMSKQNVRGNLTVKTADVAATHAEGLEYTLSEGNSYGHHGIPGLSNGGEQTIWGVDHLLQIASLGIKRMHFHNGRGFTYNVLQPVALEGTGVDDGTGLQGAHVSALYHALLIVAEATGKGEAKVVEIPTSIDSLAAYGVYEDGKLVRLVIINSDIYVEGMGERSGTRVKIDGVRGKARRFHTPFTNATKGFTWAGQSFETPTSEPTGDVVEEPVDGSVELEATSVVLIALE
ncbi:hypothetical protein CC85DRAFT_314754 [Cutaneotrichosporon oleaginosum]|uniref:Beta-glucuronidase C-terminal domain-containing protein n=1 Tax=Cutaneotrichosporon oleaginosum TaxID=879819 RepID=A0A0J0XZR6_9TREE|nr:uncharacterized protein CC85DRAFT_314754 [Cutaneotrichosporon oleaginosum]KLT46550.1 hypothetical protein CC85DRAFT_314754 [Cutaneotrichosporon oleaginosum]TXT15083.1 hypothetical protein COLE_01276 [Cutaneotrichosporon oleaginosum]